jgi:hypothetical protein
VAIKSASVCASLEIFLACCRLPGSGRAYKQSSPYLLMHIESEKTIASKCKIQFSACGKDVSPCNARSLLALRNRHRRDRSSGNPPPESDWRFTGALNVASIDCFNFAPSNRDSEAARRISASLARRLSPHSHTFACGYAVSLHLCGQQITAHLRRGDFGKRQERIEFVNIPIPCCQQVPIRFTFFWTASGRWEG